MIPESRQTPTWIVRRLALPALLVLAGTVAAQQLPAPLDETPLAPGLPAPVPWERLDAAGRADVRERYAAWRALSEADRARIAQAQTQLAALPPDQQQALRTRFDAMDRLHRDSWQLGPRLGRHYPALQPLFGFVPAGQRVAALALLRSLDEAQLTQLAAISQRTAPQDRAALRAQLLGLPAAARADWLRAHAAR